MHVGTHGLCVRPNNRAFVFHSPSADARTVRPYMLVAGTMDCQGVDTVGRMKGKVGNDRYFGINSQSMCHTVPWSVHGNV